MGCGELGSEGGEEGRDHEDRGKKLEAGQGEVREFDLERHHHFKGLFIFADPSFSPRGSGCGIGSCPLALGAPQDHEGLRSPA